MATALLGKKIIDDDLLEELEEQLLIADVGVEATQTFMKNLTARLSRKELKDVESLLLALKDDMTQLLKQVEKPLTIEPKTPYIILMVGVNGAGKTTSFYMIVGLIKPNGGSIHLDQQDITKYPMYKRAQHGIGYLAQEASVFRKLSIEDNIMSGKQGWRLSFTQFRTYAFRRNSTVYV